MVRILRVAQCFAVCVLFWGSLLVLLSVLLHTAASKKDRQYNGHTEKDKRQTLIYKILRRDIRIEKHEHEPLVKAGVNSGAPEG